MELNSRPPGGGGAVVDAFRSAFRARMAEVCAPDRLRVRIGMMLALEQLLVGAGEPGGEWPR